MLDKERDEKQLTAEELDAKEVQAPMRQTLGLKPWGHLPSPEDGPRLLTANHWPPNWFQLS